MSENIEGYVLVTGSAGFIGYNLTLELLSRGCRVIGVDNFNDYYSVALKEKRSETLRGNGGYVERRMDLRSIEDLNFIFREFRVERVCHLAAQAGVRYSLDHPHVYEQSNLAAFLNILEAVRHNGVPRLVYASSSSVYGGNTKIPFSESDRVDTPVSLYAATKKANELMAHCYTHLYGFQSVGLRFFTVYGPWGRPDMAMWLFTEAIKSGKPIKVFNNGDMRRDFTYVDDIVKGVVAAVFADGLDDYEVFNLGNNKSEHLMDMIGVLERSLGKVAEKEFLPLQPGDVPETAADIDKARAKLGFEPETSIDEGIPEFVAWYEEHSDLTSEIARSRDCPLGA
ncbi:MAG: NAD-dependent epimerase/dehydratase family protein [Kiritimatiellaeota bacterium]|nr:NAD-dependent epimerase/dehydratase family protein [Kiritimatiellota bacterium]